VTAWVRSHVQRLQRRSAESDLLRRAGGSSGRSGGSDVDGR
jgi:hypothetical protein